MLPSRLAQSPGARDDIDTLLKRHPDLTAHLGDSYGTLTPLA
ncbi:MULTISPECIES: hypothetical protein [Kitasatospora]|nr:hypothetical protein [Kitasatospora sp. GP30]MDH6142682.1 hypothetical protein [Kitasatospora sp. GP30]